MDACLSANFRQPHPKGAETRATDHGGDLREALHNKGQKNDYNDTEAITEAALRPNLHLVHEKTQDQVDLQAWHCVRGFPRTI